MNIEVILREDIKSIGKAGDVVKVKPGFARNYLFPQGKAAAAGEGNLKELEHHKRAAQVRQSKLKKGAEELAARLAGLSITVKKEAGEGDKLFGSVTSKDIADALRREKITIDKRAIELAQPIKQLGIFEVPIRLHTEVTANLKLLVVKA